MVNPISVEHLKTYILGIISVVITLGATIGAVNVEAIQERVLFLQTALIVLSFWTSPPGSNNLPQTSSPETQRRFSKTEIDLLQAQQERLLMMEKIGILTSSPPIPEVEVTQVSDSAVTQVTVSGDKD